MQLLKYAKIALLIVILAEEIRSTVKQIKRIALNIIAMITCVTLQYKNKY
ncbi:hypothetical protein [Staphylococcus chromogenes]|nr:hypothetical protein [Staphylococcus chromogenes]MEB7825601.1 hypothetical protein [Staphylococcus chromogenes]